MALTPAGVLLSGVGPPPHGADVLQQYRAAGLRGRGNLPPEAGVIARAHVHG